MTLRPLVIERLHDWHIPWLKTELRRGRRLVHRGLDASTERSNWVRSATARGDLSLLELDPPLVAFQTPAGDLAIAFVTERSDQILRDRPARGAMEVLFGGPRIVQAYRKLLADQLTRFFELELLADAAQRTLGSPVDLVPDAVRDVDIYLVGERITRGWSHPARHPVNAGIPAWLRATHGIHRAARATRAKLGMFRSALGPADPGDVRPHRYKTAIAVVSRAREVPASWRAAGYLVDDRRILRDQTLFVPLFAPTSDELARLRARELHVAEAGRGRPDRPRYLRIAVAHLLRWDWHTRAANELLATHRYWSGLIGRYSFDTFVSVGDTGVWPVARNVLLSARGIRTVGYNDSANHGFHRGQTQHSRGPAIAHFACLQYDEFVTWNDRMLRFLADHAQAVGRYHVVGCQWSDLMAAARARRATSPALAELRRRGLREHDRLVAVFDSWYYQWGVHQADDLATFLLDMIRLLDDRPEVFVALKKKVPIVFAEGDARRIYALHDRIARHPRAHLFPPGTDTTEIAAISDAIICFPFTSVVLEALPAGIPGAFYDACERLRGWYLDGFPGLFLHGYDELLRGIDTMLGGDPARFLAAVKAAEERPTELYLELGALERLRAIVSGSAPAAK